MLTDEKVPRIDRVRAWLSVVALVLGIIIMSGMIVTAGVAGTALARAVSSASAPGSTPTPDAVPSDVGNGCLPLTPENASAYPEECKKGK